MTSLQKIPIFIKIVSTGRTIEVSVNPSDKVLSIKKLLQAKKEFKIEN